MKLREALIQQAPSGCAVVNQWMTTPLPLGLASIGGLGDTKEN